MVKQTVETITGDESPNDWFACPQRRSCGHIGVHPDGVHESCPECGSGLERFSGTIFKCGDCGREHVGRGDAEDCYHSHQ